MAPPRDVTFARARAGLERALKAVATVVTAFAPRSSAAVACEWRLAVDSMRSAAVFPQVEELRADASAILPRTFRKGIPPAQLHWEYCLDLARD